MVEPKLLPAGQNGLVAAAKNIRTLLAFHFPATRFTVRSSRFSMGNSISVGWTDGPTTAEVEEHIGQFSAGTFDGMTDCYEYHKGPKDFGSTKYLSCNREYSQLAKDAAKVHFANYNRSSWREYEWELMVWRWMSETSFTFLEATERMAV